MALPSALGFRIGAVSCPDALTMVTRRDARRTTTRPFSFVDEGETTRRQGRPGRDDAPPRAPLAFPRSARCHWTAQRRRPKEESLVVTSCSCSSGSRSRRAPRDKPARAYDDSYASFRFGKNRTRRGEDTPPCRPRCAPRHTCRRPRRTGRRTRRACDRFPPSWWGKGHPLGGRRDTRSSHATHRPLDRSIDRSIDRSTDRTSNASSIGVSSTM